ncbi:MAG: hypothetical protein OHK0024_17690 [Thalassobaculales bacterium]
MGPLGIRIAGAGVLLLAGLVPMPAGLQSLAGPVPAQVLAVIDGDTLAVRAHVWLGQTVETKVRLAGIDTPELRGRCPRERALAEQARQRLSDAVAGGEVVLTGIHFGKYAGRVVATVHTPAGQDLAAMLRGAGLARAYRGGGRESWCG